MCLKVEKLSLNVLPLPWNCPSSDFQKKDLEYTDANDLWEEFANRLHTAVNAHIPSKIVPKRNSTPWISHTVKVKRLHKRKQRAYNKARKSGTQEDWDKFRELRKLFKKESRSRKAYRSLICQYNFPGLIKIIFFVSPQLKEYHVVGRRLPSDTLTNPPLFKMRIFAPDHVVAKSRYWYFIKKLKKIKKTKGEIVLCQEVSFITNVYCGKSAWSAY